MAKLVCADYGYDCEFTVEGESDQVAEKFRIHTEEVHGIESVSYTHLTLPTNREV